MKNKKRILIILFLMMGWSIVAFVSVYSYQKGKEEVASIMKECLDKAIDTDYQQRLNQVLAAYSPIGKTDFCLLCLPVEHQTELVSLKTISHTLWPKEYNTTNKIYHHIYRLKNTLKVFPDYRIETVPGIGYRLTGPEITVEG